MTKKWTPAQIAAIETTNKTLLVSAAAGSGKTTTLTERIIRRILDPNNPADISKMLIVTFTKASAADLKKKILEALNDALAAEPSNKHLTDQLIKLGNAKICTIDSFYLDIVRSNFSELGLSPSFRIVSGGELDILSKEIMSETIDRFYESDDEFSLFAECFADIKNPDRLIDIFLNLYTHLRSIPEGIEFLKIKATRTEEQAELDFFATDYGKAFKEQIADAVQHYFNVFSSACEYLETDQLAYDAYFETFEYQKNFCQELLDAIKTESLGYTEAKNLLLSYAPPRAGSLKAADTTQEFEEHKAQRKKISDKIKDLTKKSFSKEPHTISRAMHDTSKYTYKLYEVLADFSAKLDEEKKKRNFLDFGDIRRYTLKLLVNPDGTPTSTAIKYSNEFTDIYIDEYQDVDKVQDIIFTSISKPTNRFMVGDIKQSIYSFRGAEPQVFASYRSAFPDHDLPSAADSDNQAIFMSENFRCDKSVIDFTNLVCSYIFSSCSDSIGYRSADDLVFSKSTNDDYIPSPAQIKIISLQKSNQNINKFNEDDSLEEDITSQQAEAEYIASEIYRLITTETKANGSDILPGDIAVLFRSKAIGRYIAEALRKYGIASTESDNDKYFENPDVLMMLCILNSIDNPRRDIYLTGTLRSPLFGFSMDEIIQIRLSCDISYPLYDAVCKYAQEESNRLAQNCQEFISTLSEWRTNSYSMAVDKFLRFLFNTDMFIASGLLSSPCEKSDGNILRLYEYARTFESSSFKGLYQFIEYINTLIEEEKKLESPPVSISHDKVSLMTIHKSKGLEFPVCFVCEANKQFNLKESKESLVFEFPLGVAMKISDSSGFAKINTPMREAVMRRAKTKYIEEEMRILYVAMTRARERLYITASTSKSPELLMDAAATRAMFGDRHTIINCLSYLEWILTATEAHSKKDFYDISFIDGYEFIGNVPNQAKEEIAVESQEIQENKDLLETLKNKFSFSYPYLDFKRIPAKISVSKLSPDILDENNESVSISKEDKHKEKASVPDFFLDKKIKKVSATERGTATHLFLQFCDFNSAIKNGLDHELSRLIEQKFIPENTAKLIFKDELERFFNSELITEILNAKEIIREQRFNILLPASEFTQNAEFSKKLARESLAVQGVIDLILIDKNGNICVYDYKTDRLSREELSSDKKASEKMNELHALQLSYYAKAVEAIFEAPCHKLCVYSTHAAKLFDINVAPLSIPDTLDTL